jgi:tetratricopeptide (TPR) repeat protein
MRIRYALVVCLLLAACGSPAPTEVSTPTVETARLPTRLPPATATATPTLVSAEAYYERGLELQHAGELDDARRHFDWAIERDPSLAEAHVARGALHLGQENLEQALQDAERALAIDPTSQAHLLRGEALRLMGRYEEALAAFDSALALNGRLREATFQSRWLAALALQDDERLAAMASQYGAAYPDEALRGYYQAWSAIEANAHEEAVSTLVDVIEEDPRPPALLWYALGRAYMGAEAWEGAVTALERARDLVQRGDGSMALHSQQPLANLFSALGQAYLGAGRCADAETMLAYALTAASTGNASRAGSRQVIMDALEEARACQTSTTPSPSTPAAGG